MRHATAVLGPMFFLVTIATASCGGDDSSTTSATSSTGGGAGASTSSTTSATGGSGGSSTGSGGSGGSSADAGMNCPASQPTANAACNLDHDCIYGSVMCSCVDSMWTCNGAPGDAGGQCPMADPDPGESCTVQGLTCTYGGGLMCTCDTSSGWACVQPRAR